MNVLVTGGAGFIGSHVCLRLAEAGHKPITYDNLSEGHQSAVQWGPLMVGDLSDSQKLRQTLRDYKIDAVLHFAASAYVGESVKNPQKYYLNNTANTLTLLEAMLAEQVKQIVFSSTCATYGIPSTFPITEASRQQPINPYGKSKLFVEHILQDYSSAYGLQFGALRYFNVTGSDPQGRIGENHQPETHLLPLVVGAALGVYPPVSVFGFDYDTPDGTAIRDYVHVMDLADAHVKALLWLQQHPGQNLELNLGTEHGSSVLEIIQLTEKLLKRKVPYKACPRRAGDPPKLVASAHHAKAILDWEPTFTLAQSIQHTATWMEKTHLEVVK
jgi:UDP-arabinose 4-epimerase